MLSITNLINMESWQEGAFESQEQQNEFQQEYLRCESENMQIVIQEDNQKLLTALALKEIFKDSEAVIKEFENNVKSFYTSQKIVCQDNEGIIFESGLTLKYTQPKELTEADLLKEVQKKEDELAKAREKLDDFRHGCIEKKSQPQLRFGTTNKNFKEAIILEKHKLFQELKPLNEIKNFVKQIEQ